MIFDEHFKSSHRKIILLSICTVVVDEPVRRQGGGEWEKKKKHFLVWCVVLFATLLLRQRKKDGRKRQASSWKLEEKKQKGLKREEHVAFLCAHTEHTTSSFIPHFSLKFTESRVDERESLYACVCGIHAVASIQLLLLFLVSSKTKENLLLFSDTTDLTVASLLFPYLLFCWCCPFWFCLVAAAVVMMIIYIIL